VIALLIRRSTFVVMTTYRRHHAQHDATRLKQLGIRASALRPMIEQALLDNQNHLSGDHEWRECEHCGFVRSADSVVAQGVSECLLFMLEGWPLDEAEECIADTVALLAD